MSQHNDQDARLKGLRVMAVSYTHLDVYKRQIPAGGDWHGVGTGFAAADGALSVRLQDRLVSVDAAALPHAADVARLGALMYARGEAIAPERVEPAYLRNNVALTIAEQQALRERA